MFRKAKRSGSNIFALFSQKQIQEFKEAFGIMDTDKDGIITASDLKNAFTAVGKSVSDGDASSMLSEAPGPVNFTQLVTLFAEKMAGGKFISVFISLIHLHVVAIRSSFLPRECQ